MVRSPWPLARLGGRKAVMKISGPSQRGGMQSDNLLAHIGAARLEEHYGLLIAGLECQSL